MAFNVVWVLATTPRQFGVTFGFFSLSWCGFLTLVRRLCRYSPRLARFSPLDPDSFMAGLVLCRCCPFHIELRACCGLSGCFLCALASNRSWMLWSRTSCFLFFCCLKIFNCGCAAGGYLMARSL